MPTIGELTSMCKAGNIAEAYEQAAQELKITPGNIWSQRAMGWVLYYLLKKNVSENKVNEALNTLKALNGLTLLRNDDSDMFFNSLAWELGRLAGLIPMDGFGQMNSLFAAVKAYIFTPSKGYSYFAQQCIKFGKWTQAAEFIEWWGWDSLLPEDYQKIKLPGREIISLAERLYIAYARAILRLADKNRMTDFLPRIKKLADTYPKMLYPGYYCAKLMLALGADREEMQKEVNHFIRQKQSEFWVWSFVSEMYDNNIDMQLACLLRATHCKTQEEFLVKVRTKLVYIYLSKGDYPRAKYQLDTVISTFLRNRWNLSLELNNLSASPWHGQGTVDNSDPFDYLQLTNPILLQGTNENVAAVVYTEIGKGYAIVVYEKEKSAKVLLRVLPKNIKYGDLIKIHWVPKSGQGINVLHYETMKTSSLPGLSYIKVIDGPVIKQAANPYAFVKGKASSCFVSSEQVLRYGLVGGENVSALSVLNYDKKKGNWNWTCLQVEKK